MTDRSANREMLRHTGVSYFLLMILVWASYCYVFLPVVGVWQAYVDETQGLRQELRQNEMATRKLNSKLADLQEQLNDTLADGQTSPLSDASLISHHLQQQLKALLSQHSGTIVQLSPSTLSSADRASDSLLDIRFRIGANRLDALLQNLAMLKPTVFVQMLSLRQASVLPGKVSSKRYEGQLEASLVLSVAFFDQLMTNKLKLAGIDITAINQTASLQSDQAALERQQRQPDISLAYLAGLFDADFRLRLRDPRPDQYRLAAITLSSNTQVAVIADPLRDITHRLRVGEFLNGWRIEAIEQQGVSLVKGEKTEVLELPAQ